MAIYSDLQFNRFYLIIEKEGDEIILVQPLMETDSCILLMNMDEDEKTFWRKRDASFIELIDELDDEQLAEYENLFEEDEEDFDDEDED